MLSINELPPHERDQIRKACGYVFSADQMYNEVFLNSLEFDLVRQAFREKVKRYHPDLHGHEEPRMQEKRKERFVRIMESYETLKNYLIEDGSQQAVRPRHGKTIIAVGGAKGGIGKSLFSANLGIFLHREGHRTVLVDLDLGGANLHLYLGETFLPLTINDFLDQRAASVEEIIADTRYGPKLIGGDSSRLGAANIDFAIKLKLMKAIRLIEADCIILDLGGDTSYNMIDFFLQADLGIVLTTCDPSSYLDAYNFIKVSLFRKLNRIFGAESRNRLEKDPELLRLIAEATLSKNGSRVKTVSQLMKRIEEQMPHYLGLINARLDEFRPLLAINMVEPDSNEGEVAERILQVSHRMLSVQVEYLGSLPYQKEIKRSAREMVPAVAQYPGKPYWRLLDAVLKRIESTPPRA